MIEILVYVVICAFGGGSLLMACQKYGLIEFLAVHSGERWHKILTCYTCKSILFPALVGIVLLIIFRDWNVFWGILCSPIITKHFIVG